MDFDEKPDYSMSSLEQRTYRQLQKLAKSLKLPSNYKKVYLVQLIHAKKYLTEDDVENIIQIVKHERQQNASSRKNKSKKKPRSQEKVQNTEISSTNALSPSMHSTPKRPRRSQDTRPHPPTLSPIVYSQNNTDRVLRSTILKTYHKPKYSLLEDDYVYGVIATRKTDDPNEPISIVRSQHQPGGNRRWPVRRHGISLLTSNNEQHSVICSTSQVTQNCFQPTITLGNLPLANYGVQTTIDFRRADGKIAKIKALVHNTTTVVKNTSVLVQTTSKVVQNTSVIVQNTSRVVQNTSRLVQNREIVQKTPLFKNRAFVQKTALKSVQNTALGEKRALVQKAVVQKPQKVYKMKPVKQQSSPLNVAVTVQDIINSRINAQAVKSSISEIAMNENIRKYPNMSPVTEELPNDTVTSTTQEKEIYTTGLYTIYKQNTESNFTSRVTGEDVPDSTVHQPLPGIEVAFGMLGRFDNDIRSPLYIAIDDEPQSVPAGASEANQEFQLEKLYTLKGGCLPPPEFTTNASTQCVNTALTSPTVVVQPTAAWAKHLYHDAPCYDYDAFYEPHECAFDEPQSESEKETVSQVERALLDIDMNLSQDYDDEMLEEAQQYVDEDGVFRDYMATAGTASCILCSWAGSKFDLQYHIRTEHADQIVKQYKNTWNTTTKLSTLVNQDVWLSYVAEFQSTLYVLSLKYEDPDCFMVSLTNISSWIVSKRGKITIYNKVTGEPYYWEGVIEELPLNMPYENTNCLKIQLSKLELLPNSANLKLLNRELVLMSPSRTVVGKPELADIHIIVFVDIFDSALF